MPDRLLTLVRHAKSTWRYPRLDDARRPLSVRGLRDCRRMPREVARRLPVPDLVLTSDAARALQTCEALAAAFDLDGGRVAIEPELYLAEAPAIARRVRALDDRLRHVALVGHNPGLTDVYNALAGERLDNLPTFAVAHLEAGTSRWRELESGSARVVMLLRPRDLD